jgi:hypothetical protein
MGDPRRLGQFVRSYLEDAHKVRQAVEKKLRAVIQALIDDIVIPPVATK